MPARKSKTGAQTVPQLVRHDCMPGQFSGAPARQPARRPSEKQGPKKQQLKKQQPKKQQPTLVRHNCMNPWADAEDDTPVITHETHVDDTSIITHVTHVDDPVASVDLTSSQ